MSFRRSAGPDINSLRPIRVFNTESFRSAALFAGLFLVLSWVLLGAVYWIVDDTQTAALIGAIDADINTIENGYRAEGLPEAIEVVHQRLGSGKYAGADLPGGYILIRDAASGTMAGNVRPDTLQLGLFNLSVPRSGGSAATVPTVCPSLDLKQDGVVVLRPPQRHYRPALLFVAAAVATPARVVCWCAALVVDSGGLLLIGTPL